MTGTPVRLSDLHEGIKNVMRGIVPSYEPSRSETWVYDDFSRPHEGVNRLYTIHFRNNELGAAIANRNPWYDVDLIIRTTYMVEEWELDLKTSDDQQDIMLALLRGIDPVTPGLLAVNFVSEDPEIVGETERQYEYVVEFTFPITYKRRGELGPIANT